MATSEYRAEAVIVREQRTMFAPTLDDMIDDDHEVRLLDEALRTLDWTEWESVYIRERATTAHSSASHCRTVALRHDASDSHEPISGICVSAQH